MGSASPPFHYRVASHVAEDLARRRSSSTASTLGRPQLPGAQLACDAQTAILGQRSHLAASWS
jgi:hypothetical protein